MLYDPPSGWRYGFPKLYKPLEGETLEETLVGNGSVGKVKIMVEEFQSKEWGKIIRTTLKEVNITNLVPYENDKVEQMELPV